MPSRPTCSLAGTLLLATSLMTSCKEQTPPRPTPVPDATPTSTPSASVPGGRTELAPPKPKAPAPGTRIVLAKKTTDETWDKMLVAGGRLWVLTNLSRWTDGPMYVPAARLWSVPIEGGELTRHLDLEGMGTLAADATHLYVSVNRNLGKSAPRSGRVLRYPLTAGSGAAASDVVTGIEPRAIAVDGDTLWIDDTRVAKDGKSAPVASGAKAAVTFAFDDDSAYFTTTKGAGPAGDQTGARVFRVAKSGGAPKVLAAKLPAEATGLAVDATHVYFCAVSWTSPAAEAAGVIARVPKDGGEVEILAKDQPAVRKLWIDDANVYVLSGRGGRPASIVRVGKSGGEVTTVASDSTLEYAAMDASSVYFSSDGVFDASSHARTSPANLVRVVLR